MIVAPKTPHRPDYREHLLALAAACMARANEDDPGGIQALSLIPEMPDSRAQ